MQNPFKLRSLPGLFAVIGLASSIAGSAAAQRDEQWIYRAHDGSGSGGPTAVFLSWSYTEVLFRATCDEATSELVLQYYGDAEDSASPLQDLKLGRGDTWLSGKTVIENGVMEGRFALTAASLSLLRGSGDLEIDAPNEMGEPWYVGGAEPLTRVAEGCERH